MRAFHVSLSFQNRGGGYSINHEGRVQTTSMHTAIARVVKDAKKKYGRRFRVAEGAQFTARVMVGATVNGGENEN